MVMEMANESVSPEGNLRMNFKVTEAVALERPGMMPGMIEAMQMGLKTIEGMSGWNVVTPRGITTDGDVSLPPGADPGMVQTMDSMKQQMNQMSSPLPAEAVGLGAKWRVTQVVEGQGLKIDQTATYEVVELLGDLVKLKISMVQTAERQMMKLPNLPPSASAELTKLESGGEGTMEIDLKKVIPQSTLKMKMDMKCTIRAGAEQVPMAMMMKMKVNLKPREVTVDDEGK